MMQKECRGIALNFNTNIHWTDHLAPLCVIMEIPLLLTNEKHAEQASIFYPELEIQLVNWEGINLQYLVERFDVFFQSQLWHRDEFYRQCEPWEKIYKKTIRNVYCPHGFSDKVFWFEKSVWEDILLVYGENMMDLFKERGIEEHLNAVVRTGNIRYLFYRTHQKFYDLLVQERILNRLDRSKPTIIYAPTCHDMENTTSFFHVRHLLDQLPSDYNLIIKLHPLLEETDPAAVYALLGRYENKKNIVIIKDQSLVYPILAHSDIYVGDMSSVGYDFLVFNRPMFFLNQLKRDSEKDRNLFLYRCGYEIQPEEYANFFKIMESQLPYDQERFGSIRQEVYHYTFGKDVPFKDLKNNIIQACLSPKKDGKLDR